jgi:hypothetical protein
METPKQTIAYFDKTQRIRLAFTLPGEDGSRQDVWIKYTETRHSPTDQSRPRAKFYSGPEEKKLPGGIKKVDRYTLVKELDVVFAYDWRAMTYPLWKAQFGEAQHKELGERVESTDGKRKRDDDYDTAVHKRAHSDENPTQSADLDDKIQSAVEACHMSEKEVLRAFNDYDQPVSDFVLHRVQCITMRVLKTKSVPPMTLIRKIRATENYIIPWDHSAWQLWEESVKPTDRHQKVESSKRGKVNSSERDKEHEVDTETVSAPKTASLTDEDCSEFDRLIGKWFKGYD